ncbi:odorant receptor 131-2-like [Gadus morhua]|uniref:odorant receptor 131-2-like n=1 Tax=Gadus morhua TaxID=8049 RepID=UPI0011B6D173|nr:odorant receptor 131-2-like [Gadus morhua]
MHNVTGLSGNSTSPTNLHVIIKVCVVVPFFSIFLFCIVLMLYIFASNRHFMDSTRYILFAFMLVNDTLVMLSSVLLFLLAMGQSRFPIVFCAPLLFFSTASFLNTPLILATMSLERYVAIMYPLRCPPLWRSDRVWFILLCLWLISCVLPTVDFSIAGARPGVDVLSTPIYCNPVALNSSPVQILFKVSLNGLFFGTMAVIILYTYIKILLETKKMRQDRASVNKAMHTVLLHGFQLLLCLMSFTNPITERLLLLNAYLLPGDIYFFTFFCFGLIPRFLSPLIYGLRDKSLRDHMRKVTFCCSYSLKTRGMLKPSRF